MQEPKFTKILIMNIYVMKDSYNSYQGYRSNTFID